MFTRFLPIWYENIPASLLSDKKIVNYFKQELSTYTSQNISDGVILNLNIYTDVSLIYELDKWLNPINNYFTENSCCN